MKPSLALVLLCGCTWAQQASAPAAKTFVPSDELNAQLPKWLRFSGEYRARFEAVTGANYRENASDAYLLNRFRLNMRIIPTSWLKFNFQAQDARVFGKNQNPAAPPFQDTFDLRMAYVELGDPESKTIGLRVGRQELVFGEQRLVGHVSWLNTARTFDAARLTLRHKGYRLDAFASSVVNVRDKEWNHHQDGNNFHGLYGGMEKLVPNAVIEPYVFWRIARRYGNIDFKTTGVRMAGKLPANWDYGFEMAKQTGSYGADDMDAWAGHWRVGRTIGSLRYKPRLIGEYNYASGDGSATDGKRGTFDILYPTPHDKYGLSDQVGWKNIHHVRFGPELKPHAKWLLSSNYHSWWLANSRDGLYAAGGGLVARIASGAPNKHVGHELDFQAVYTANKQVQVAGGFAHIFPGAFLKAATPGKSYNFPYVMLGYSF